MDYEPDIEEYVMRRLKNTSKEEQTNIDAGLKNILELIVMDLDNVDTSDMPADALKPYNILLGQLDTVNDFGIYNIHDVLTLSDRVYESIRCILGDLRDDYIQHCKKEQTEPNKEYLKTFTVDRDDFNTYIADIHNEIRKDRLKVMAGLNVTRAAMICPADVIIDEHANINIKKGTYGIKPTNAPLMRYMSQKTEDISTDNTFTQGYPREVYMVKYILDMQAIQDTSPVKNSTDITL